jgi:hypothetical protein
MLALGYSHGGVPARSISQDGLEFIGPPLRQHPLHGPIAIDENVRQRCLMAHQYDLFSARGHVAGRMDEEAGAPLAAQPGRNAINHSGST